MKGLKNYTNYLLIFCIFILQSCTLKITGKDYEAYHLEGELATASHFGDFTSGFEYDACGIIAVDGKNPIIKQYEWDWDSNGVADQVTYPPECKTSHIYKGEEVGIVTPSVKVVVEDGDVKKSYAAQTALEDTNADNVFYTWNYGSWALNGGVVDDSSCSNLKAGETCSLSFFAKYDDNGSTKNLPFAAMCIVPTGMNQGVLASNIIKPTVAATVGEFKAMLNSNSSVSPQVKELILEDLAKSGMVLDGSDSSFLKFSSGSDCQGVQFVTNSKGTISFDFTAKTKFLETADERACLNSISEISSCDLQNTQTIKFQSYSSVTTSNLSYVPLVSDLLIGTGEPASWKVFDDDLNYSADEINAASTVNYNLIVFDTFGNPVSENAGLDIQINDPISSIATISKSLSVNAESTSDISLFNFSVNYSSEKARTLELSLSKSGYTVNSANVAITHGTGFEIVCAPDCSEIKGVIKTSSSGFAKVQVNDAYGNIVDGEESDKPVVTWSIATANGDLPVLEESTIVTDSSGYNKFNLNKLTHGKRRGNYELKASLGTFSKTFPIKTLPGSVAGISFSAYNDNAENPESGLNYLKKIGETSGDPFVFKKINYETLSSNTYGKAVKVFIVDEENNIIEKEDLSISAQTVSVLPESMIDHNGNIDSNCPVDNGNHNCQVSLKNEKGYSNSDPVAESFSINSVLNYDLNVSEVKFIAFMNVAGSNYSVVSDAVTARMGYGYEIKEPVYSFDGTSWNGFTEENSLYVLNFDKDALVKFTVCPADIDGGLDPRDADLSISTIIELLDEQTNIFNENVLNNLGKTFDDMGVGVSNCVDAELEYTYPENQTVLNEELAIEARDNEPTISSILGFTVHSLNKAGLFISTNEVNFGEISYYDNSLSDLITISKTGEQSLVSGINASLVGANGCFELSDLTGAGSDNVSFRILAKGENDSCIGSKNASINISAQTASNQNLSASIQLKFERLSKPDIKSDPASHNFTNVYSSDSGTVSKIFSISNTGSTPVTIKIAADSGNPDMFVVDGSNCNNVEISSSSSSCDVKVSINKTSITYGVATGKFLVQNLSGSTILPVSFSINYYYGPAKFAFNGSPFYIQMNKVKNASFILERDPKSAPAFPTTSMLGVDSSFSISGGSTSNTFNITYLGSHGATFNNAVTVKAVNCWVDAFKTCSANVVVTQPDFEVTNDWTSTLSMLYGSTKTKTLTFSETVSGWETISSLVVTIGTVPTGITVTSSVSGKKVTFTVTHNRDTASASIPFSVAITGSNGHTASFSNSIDITTSNSGTGLSLNSNVCALGYIKQGWVAGSTRTCTVTVSRSLGYSGGTVSFNNFNAPSGFTVLSASPISSNLTYGSTKQDFILTFRIVGGSTNNSSTDPVSSNTNTINAKLGTTNNTINVSGFVEVFAPTVSYGVPSSVPSKEYKESSEVATLTISNTNSNVAVNPSALSWTTGSTNFTTDSCNFTSNINAGSSSSCTIKSTSSGSSATIAGTYSGTAIITSVAAVPTASSSKVSPAKATYKYTRLSPASLSLGTNSTISLSTTTNPLNWNDTTSYGAIGITNNGGSTAVHTLLENSTTAATIWYASTAGTMLNTNGKLEGAKVEYSSYIKADKDNINKKAGCYTYNHKLSYYLSQFTTDTASVSTNVTVCRKPPAFTAISLARVDLDDVSKTIFTRGFTITSEASSVPSGVTANCTLDLGSKEVSNNSLGFPASTSYPSGMTSGIGITSVDMNCTMSSVVGGCTNCITSTSITKGTTVKYLEGDTISGQSFDYKNNGAYLILKVKDYTSGVASVTGSSTSTNGFTSFNCGEQYAGAKLYICTLFTVENGSGTKSTTATISVGGYSYSNYNVSYTRKAAGYLSWSNTIYTTSNTALQYVGSSINPSFAASAPKKYHEYSDNIQNVWLRLFPIGYGGATSNYSCLEDVKIDSYPTGTAVSNGLLNLSQSTSGTQICSGSYINYTLADTNTRMAGCYTFNATFSAKKSAYASSTDRSTITSNAEICRKAAAPVITISKKKDLGKYDVTINFSLGATSLELYTNPAFLKSSIGSSAISGKTSYTMTIDLSGHDYGTYTIIVQVKNAENCTDGSCSSAFTEKTFTHN